MAHAPFFLRLILSLALAWLVVPAAQAQAHGPYEGEVEVASQSDADRAAALPQALAQVLAKSGVSAQSGRDADAARLLQQYRYRQDAQTVDGVPVRRLYLIARFDAAAIQRLLDGSGAVVVAPPRVQPILWLAIDDGSGARIVSQDAAAAVLPLTTRAGQRGLRLRLPAWDAQDQSILYARDLAGEETYAVDTATRRYGGPALVGWLRREASGWVADWRLREGESEIARWQSRDLQAAAVLAAGADGAVDALARRRNEVVLTGAAGRYRVVVQGLIGGADYARVLDALRRQSIVRAVEPRALEGDRLEMDLDLGAGVESLLLLLEGGVLETVAVGDAGTPTVLALRR